MEADLLNSERRAVSISGDIFAIGLLSISKPFPFRNSTIVAVPTFSSLATLTSLLLIRLFKHLDGGVLTAFAILNLAGHDQQLLKITKLLPQIGEKASQR
jgi:hypothetical protein